MRALRFCPPALLLLTALGTGRADDKVLVPGNPPLTRDVLDDYGKLAEWRLGPALARLGGLERLMKMVTNDWKTGEAAWPKAVLAAVKWWREDYPKMSPADRDRLAGKTRFAAPPPDRPGISAKEADAIHMAKLKRWHDARMSEIRFLSDAQAKHHETMMRIIDNLRPSGRYEYNPATGRHDRYVPD